MKQIDLHGRKTNTESGQDKLLNALYSTAAGRMLLSPLVTPAVSRLIGRLLDTRPSCLLIRPFIKANHIDMKEFRPGRHRSRSYGYRSYNDFFTRKIKPGARPLDSSEDTLLSPCDSYATAYEITDDLILTVKDTGYSLPSLLKSHRLAAHFGGGYAVILRLTVSDYHRYSYAVSGTQSKNYHIPGIFHTVNPVANDYYPIYKENTREFTVIRSDRFGRVLQMEVGALMVGRIVNHKESCPVKRGEEKGYFEFGGSTVILLLEKNKVALRQDLLKNTAHGYETQVRLGDAIGKAIS